MTTISEQDGRTLDVALAEAMGWEVTVRDYDDRPDLVVHYYRGWRSVVPYWHKHLNALFLVDVDGNGPVHGLRERGYGFHFGVNSSGDAFASVFNADGALVRFVVQAGGPDVLAEVATRALTDAYRELNEATG